MDNRTDVVVIGSGGAALVAACVAADRGRQVVVLEKAPVFGGTTAVSGGLIWVPCNPLMADAGQEDNRADALTYLDRLTAGTVDRSHIEHFVDTAPRMVEYLIGQTPVRLRAIDFPDYHPEWAGARHGWRTLDNEPFETSADERLGSLVREGPHFPLATYDELHEWRWPEHYDWELIAERMQSGVRTLGGALVAGLVAGALDRGVDLRAETAVRELCVEDGTVTGVVAAHRGRLETWQADYGVVVASGGFEWSDSMRAGFLRGPTVNAISPPWNTGDGHRMGAMAGAAFANMSNAWWVPTYSVPGEEYDGHRLSRIATGPLALPGSIIVNEAGRRFVNEAMNYSDQTLAFHELDPVTYERPNLPAWVIFDGRFKQRYPAATVMAGDPAPPWMLRGDSPEELAEKLGINAEGLHDTIERFNNYAREGRDPDFSRGESAYDRYHGDGRHAPNPCLGPLKEPPFYAVELKPGTIGTKGGLVTSPEGAVLRESGEPIPGLYACGNVAASPTGPGYPGAGATIGAAMTAGYSCGFLVGKH